MLNELKSTSFRNRIIWIILTFFLWFIILAETAVYYFGEFLFDNFVFSNEMYFVVEMYTTLLASIAVYLIFCLIPKNRFLLKSLKPKQDTLKLLGTGILLGFATNFFCIVCALIHGDIKLYFDALLSQIPFFLFAFISVMFQSASEELWCRGMLYERINVHYPVWVAVFVNGALFGLLHSFNPGITPLAMAGLILCGFSYSLLRWYSGSIWTCIGIHTMWNFTQNLIFGLPNSGLVSEASIWHLDAVTGISNLIYDYSFGVEGAVPSLLMDVTLAVVIIVLAVRNGRIKELTMSREKEEKLKKEQTLNTQI